MGPLVTRASISDSYELVSISTKPEKWAAGGVLTGSYVQGKSFPLPEAYGYNASVVIPP